MRFINYNPLVSGASGKDAHWAPLLGGVPGTFLGTLREPVNVAPGKGEVWGLLLEMLPPPSQPWTSGRNADEDEDGITRWFVICNQLVYNQGGL